MGPETYYLDDAGLKTTGFALLEHERYYFDRHGCMHTGWLENGATPTFSSMTETCIPDGWKKGMTPIF